MSLNHFNFSEKINTVTKKYIVPQRVVLSQGADNPQWLLNDTSRQATLGVTNVCLLEEGDYVVLDFGSELQGGVDITVNRVEGKAEDKASDYCFYGKMRIVFGESVSEAMSSIGDEKRAQNDHSTRDMTVVTSNWSTMRYGNTGFRFVKIEAIEGNIELGVVKGVLEYKDIQYKGTFECNDQRLNDIFNTAVYTVHLNMQDYIWDGIKRDRLVWIGDMHPEVSTISSVFGYDDCVERSLDFTRDSFPLEDTENPRWMVFPSYTCWWIIIHRDWYMQNGRTDYLLEQKDYLYKACNNLLMRIGEDGKLDFDENYFVDWSSADTVYAEAGFRGCLMMALDAAGQIFDVYGDIDMQAKCMAALENVKKVVPDYSGNKQMSAMAAISGLCDVKSAEKVITKDLLDGLSTFYGYYVLRALALADNMQAALDVMRGYWGAMLDLGATTFWEDFDIDWVKNAGRIDENLSADKVDLHGTYGKFCYEKLRLSLCHGWAGGPADFISKNILGVHIMEPGCKKVCISPNLGDLEWAKGTYPTPYGIIEIEHHNVNGKVQSSITAPAEVEIIRLVTSKSTRSKEKVNILL